MNKDSWIQDNHIKQLSREEIQSIVVCLDNRVDLSVIKDHYETAEIAKFDILMSLYKNDSASQAESAIQSALLNSVLPQNFVIVCDGPVGSEITKLLDSYQLAFPDIFKIRQYKINRGLGAVLNDGLSLCSNDLVARIDADDINLPWRFQQQLEYFNENKDVAIIGGQIIEFNEARALGEVRSVPTDKTKLLSFAKRRCPFNHPTVMYKKSAVIESGGYPDIPGLEDYPLWAEVLMRDYEVANTANELVAMRVSEQMYGRRGGVKYLKKYTKMRIAFIKSGFNSVPIAIEMIIAMTLSTLMTPKLRKRVSQLLLRTPSQSIKP